MAAGGIMEETLGDVLGRALRGDFDDMPDVTATEGKRYLWPVVDDAGVVIGKREVRADCWWRNVSSWRACRDIAEHYDLGFADVRSVIRRMPANLAVLIDSPEGWGVLGEQVAITIMGRLPGDPMLPRVQ